jgi:hypothetical protein
MAPSTSRPVASNSVVSNSLDASVICGCSAGTEVGGYIKLSQYF